MNNFDDKRLLPLKIFLRRYSQSRANFYLLVDVGAAPRLTRIGKRIYVHVDDAEAWAIAHRQKAGTP